MEPTNNQKKKWVIIGGLVVIAVIIILAQSYRSFLGARIPAVPELSESIVGGRLKAETFQEGSNTVEFSAKTDDGRTVSDSVMFDMIPPSPASLDATLRKVCIKNTSEPNKLYAFATWLGTANIAFRKVGDASWRFPEPNAYFGDDSADIFSSSFIPGGGGSSVYNLNPNEDFELYLWSPSDESIKSQVYQFNSGTAPSYENCVYSTVE